MTSAVVQAEGFSITVSESISYLRNDYDPLEIISFDRITYWLTHFGVNHALYTKIIWGPISYLRCPDQFVVYVYMDTYGPNTAFMRD